LPNLELIRKHVSQHDPTLAGLEGEVAEAAVAVILHESTGGGPELLFIERAIREGDPWSGQMAFPGGRRDASDPHLEYTASRETLEEVGIELGAPIGRLDDFSGSRASRPTAIVVAPYVYEVAERPELTPNREVNSTVWVPLEWILSPQSAVQYEFQREEYGGTFPAVRYERYTVWGLTYRILTSFASVLGRQLPDPGL
jgi:8-oxo-dGTP pyrophosphatase MutT (NUDIX family)